MNNDLISRDALKKAIEPYRYATDGVFEGISLIIDNAQAIPQVTVFTESTDEKAVADLKAELQNVIEERPQGEWIYKNDCPCCPFCNHFYTIFSNFCPNCGADMRGGTGE